MPKALWSAKSLVLVGANPVPFLVNAGFPGLASLRFAVAWLETTVRKSALVVGTWKVTWFVEKMLVMTFVPVVKPLMNWGGKSGGPETKIVRKRLVPLVPGALVMPICSVWPTTVPLGGIPGV